MSDRTVHAAYTDMEIVRYDRAGKWYLEPTIPGLKRQQVPLRDAAAAAIWGIDNANGVHYANLPGGQSFDAAVKKWQETS